jgi:uncharacterized protein YjbI with pentapeptide repeats
MPMLVPMVLGLVVGATASWALLYPALEKAVPWVDIFIQIVLPAMGIFVAALMLVVPLAWWAIRRFIKTAHGTLEQVVRKVAAAAQAAAENNTSAATSHAREAALEAVAWYGPVAARRFVVQTALGLLVTFGGLVGTALLFRQTILLGEQNKKLAEQTDLLRNQNEKLDQQTDLFREQNTKLDLQTIAAEAQRRAGLSAELFAILEAISRLGVEVPAGTTSSQQPRGQLPRGLQARIIALSHAAAPYRIIEVPEGRNSIPRRADRDRSPERGQLLVGLVLADIDFTVLAGRITFEGADLRGARLNNAFLPHTFLPGAFLPGADLPDAILTDADLPGAVLTNAVLTKANLILADLAGANLAGADLTDANLTGAKLTDTNLNGADLTHAIVGKTVAPGKLPDGFPTGWDGPPPGWELYDDSGKARLQRSAAPASAPSPQ